MINELIRLANHFDSIGRVKEANYLDSMLKKTAWVYTSTTLIEPDDDMAVRGAIKEMLERIEELEGGRPGQVAAPAAEEAVELSSAPPEADYPEYQGRGSVRKP